ncbi:unnamed protein product [Ranitomeya imitator]|uniref:Protein SHQ1 homolog n=1 Tax=Ranitomeya imitator TaxID=111125 RepID=A0ABN9KV60_9NEOB|nr:unnamed protein product [Ranitomeya imitator]
MSLFGKTLPLISATVADLFEDDAIQHLLKYKPWWVQVAREASGTSPDSQDPRVIFTEKEKERLRKFTNKSYLLEKKAEHLAYLGLIDLLLAYCYEVRVTEGERNVESAWTVRKLSGTLSWFELAAKKTVDAKTQRSQIFYDQRFCTIGGLAVYVSDNKRPSSLHSQNYRLVTDVLVSFGRRVLCYPLYRNFCLVTRAVQDTCMLLQMGKAAVLKCLLYIHVIFQENDPAYILNDLYITDYCIWIQKVRIRSDCWDPTVHEIGSDCWDPTVHDIGSDCWDPTVHDIGSDGWDPTGSGLTAGTPRDRV